MVDLDGLAIEQMAAELRALRGEVARFQRICDEALPREVIVCPNCARPHVEGMRHGAPIVDGSKRPHAEHRCYHCTHVWRNKNADGSDRWSFGICPDCKRRSRDEGVGCPTCAKESP